MRALLAAGLILPVLDGLDEIAGTVRGLAITRINDALGSGESLVVTCRTEQYKDTVRPPDAPGAMPRAAAAIELGQLRPGDVARYLREASGGGEPAARWEPVLAALGTRPPAGQALATPLLVWLARSLYAPPRPRRPG